MVIQAVRNFEAYSEDSKLPESLGAPFVNSVQSKGVSVHLTISLGSYDIAGLENYLIAGNGIIILPQLQLCAQYVHMKTSY